MNEKRVRELLERYMNGERDFRGENLKGVSLKCENLKGVSLKGVSLKCANLYGANLNSASLEYANMAGVNLKGTMLNDANLANAYLVNANMTYSNLGCANLEGANLKGVSLKGAKLAGVNLRNANLEDANLEDANLEDADLRGVRGLPDIASPGLAARVLEQIISHPETYDQAVWHSTCGTKHCVAGLCVKLSRTEKYESLFGTAHTARLALGLPLSEICPFRPSDDPIPWLRKLAKRDNEQQ